VKLHHTQREEHWLRLFENRVKRIFRPGKHKVNRKVEKTV